MITSLSDLIEALRTKEAEVLKRHDVKHGPTIGDMYEDLTRHIVGRAIPSELGLQGFSNMVLEKIDTRNAKEIASVQ